MKKDKLTKILYDPELIIIWFDDGEVEITIYNNLKIEFDFEEPRRFLTDHCELISLIELAKEHFNIGEK